jgi:hypothetical protein
VFGLSKMSTDILNMITLLYPSFKQYINLFGVCILNICLELEVWREDYLILGIIYQIWPCSNLYTYYTPFLWRWNLMLVDLFRVRSYILLRLKGVCKFCIEGKVVWVSYCYKEAVSQGDNIHTFVYISKDDVTGKRERSFFLFDSFNQTKPFLNNYLISLLIFLNFLSVWWKSSFGSLFKFSFLRIKWITSVPIHCGQLSP